jgi:hypothetical protein
VLGQSEDQALLRDEPQRGKNSDLDRCDDIRLVATLHKNLKLPRSLRNALQILSVHPFGKTPLSGLLLNISSRINLHLNFNQLEMNSL